MPIDLDRVRPDAWPRYLNTAGMIVRRVRRQRAQAAGFEALQNLRIVCSLPQQTTLSR